jgi:copper chaperone CopZ
MKRIFPLLAVILLAALAVQADVANLKLTGVHCSKGAAAVEKAIKAVPGVLEVKTDVEKAMCTVNYDPSKTSEKALIEAVNKTEYKAESVKEGEPSSCPTVGVAVLDDFHKVLHRMHSGVNDGHFDALKENLPAMKERCDTMVKHYKDAAAGAGDEEAKKAAEGMAKLADTVSTDVASLEKAVDGGVQDSMESAFMTLHEDFYKILDTVQEKKQSATDAK